MNKLVKVLIILNNFYQAWPREGLFYQFFDDRGFLADLSFSMLNFDACQSFTGNKKIKLIFR